VTIIPSISVCVPTRNRASLLRATLSAMQRQTRPYMELIVGDDASEDNTKEVVASFQDPRIRYLRHERNVGIYANWNALIECCSGDYVCIYHDHDHYSDTILETSANLLDRHPLMSFVHTALTTVDSEDQVCSIDIRDFSEAMQGWRLREMLANSPHSPVMAATAMIRRTALSKAGPFQFKEYGLGCDKHMWFRLAGEGTVGYVAEVQAQIREREKGTATATVSWDSIFGAWRMWKDEIAEHYANNPPARARADRLMNRVQAQQTLTLSLRALILEPADIWSREEQRVVPAMGSRGRVLYRIARSSRIVRGLLRVFILPLHYWSISYRAWVAKRRAQAHLRARPLPFSRVGV
jgi:glycosyltransferase involved in cell wall biosynthesis